MSLRETEGIERSRISEGMGEVLSGRQYVIVSHIDGRLFYADYFRSKSASIKLAYLSSIIENAQAEFKETLSNTLLPSFESSLIRGLVSVCEETGIRPELVKEWVEEKGGYIYACEHKGTNRLFCRLPDKKSKKESNPEPEAMMIKDKD